MAKWTLEAMIETQRFREREFLARVVACERYVMDFRRPTRGEAIAAAEQWLREHGAKKIDNG